MSWNLRIIKDPNVSEFQYSIREVYYDINDKPILYDTNPQPMIGDDVKSLKWYHKEMAKAFKKPVLVIQENDSLKEE